MNQADLIKKIEESQNFIVNVKRLILAEKYTAYEIEKATGISRVTIGRYRNGKADYMKMSLEAAKKLNAFYIRKRFDPTDYESVRDYYHLHDLGEEFGDSRLEIFDVTSFSTSIIHNTDDVKTFTFDGIGKPVSLTGKEIYAEYFKKEVD